MTIVAVALSWTPSSGYAAHPNVVIILVDDMGYGDPGCYNAESKIPTPKIDSLARDGMRFTDAHAPGPLCHMSRYGLLTGRYPFRTDVTQWPKHPLIAEDQMTIASLLASAQYRTAMVGKWHVGFEEAGYDNPLPGGPVDRGFDSFFGIRASTDIPPYFYIRGNQAVAPPTKPIEANNSLNWSRIQGAFWREGLIAPDLELKDVLPRFTDEAVDVILKHHARNQSNQSEQPLMLYLAYPAPHTPWLPAPEFQGRSGASMYGDFMMMVDTMIGRVLKTLDDTNMTDDTLLIFTSDNGPTWYEKDVERFGHDSSGGLRGMKADAWEAGHRMPFIVRWPGKVKSDSISQQIICFTDLLATLANIVDVELPLDAGPDSFDFSNVLMDTHPTGTPIRDSLVMQSGAGLMTVRKGDWKLIEGLGSGGFTKPSRIVPGPDDPKGQLYDLANDLAESNNLYTEKPEIVEELQQELSRIQEATRTRSR
ncbi:MAG: arylsulfatase [Pirellulales bacterium]